MKWKKFKNRRKSPKEILTLAFMATFVKDDKTVINFKFFANEMMKYFCTYLNLLACEKQIRYNDFKGSLDILRKSLTVAVRLQKSTNKKYLQTYVETSLILAKNYYNLKKYKFCKAILNKVLGSVMLH